MRRESYLSQPSAVEVYPVFSGTDVIMRKNIELVDKEDIQDGKKNKYKAWECEEVQFHYQGKVTQEEIESDFDYWYAKAEEVPDPSSVEDLSLEDARKAKYQEIASACEQTIYAVRLRERVGGGVQRAGSDRRKSDADPGNSETSSDPDTGRLF